MESHTRPAVVAQLEQEWPLLARRELAVALARWRGTQPALQRFQRPEDLLVFLHGAAPHESDEPLLALLVLAGGDRDAGRFVLQAILPALKAQARRLATRPTPREELWELLLFYAWEAICTYPVEKRRRRVAANLVLLVLHHTTRELHRARVERDRRPRIDDDEALASAAPPPRLHRRGLVSAAVANRVISERDAALILQTRIDGAGLLALANTLCVPYPALRQRRQRAELALRRWADLQGDVSPAALSDLTSSATTSSRRAA